MIKKRCKVALVKRLDGIVVLTVGFAFLHGSVDERLVVVASGKLNDFGAYKDVLLTNGSFERDALQRGAA